MKDVDLVILSVVAICIGFFAFIYLPWIFIRAKAARYDPYDKLPDEGVNGWLLFLLVQVFSLQPISSAITLLSVLSLAKASAIPAINNFAYAEAMLLIIVCLASFKYHLPLINTRLKIAVTNLKRFYVWLPLVVTAGYYTCSKVFLDPTYPSVHKATIDGLPVRFLVACFASAIWYWYLSKSKRVAATYRQDEPVTRPISTPVRQEEPSWPFVKPAGQTHSGVNLSKNPAGRQYLNVFDDVFEAFPAVRVNRHEIEAASGGAFDSDVWQECLRQSKGDEVAAMALYRLRHDGQVAAGPGA
jgi:hypothetical protein